MSKQEISAIQAHLATEDATWTAGDNGLSPDALVAMLGFVVDEEALAAAMDASLLSFDPSAVPDPVLAAQDWRTRGCITSVKNQGPVGSCVSFGCNAVLEAMIKLETGYDMDLSEADLHFCSSHGPSTGGWYPDPALDEMMGRGVAEESYYPYGESLVNGVPQIRIGTDRHGRTVRVKNWKTMVSIADRKAWLSNVGPVACAIEVFSDFAYYRSGVYRKTPTATYRGGHCMMVVGYSDAEECWICKNSWGTGWGDRGYIKIGYGEVSIDGKYPFWGIEGVLFNSNDLTKHFTAKANPIVLPRLPSRKTDGKDQTGVWSYGSGTAGGTFVVFPRSTADSKGNSWGGNEGWHGLYKNTTATPQNLSGGLTPAPNDVMMHPGNLADHLTIARFTAPSDGIYRINAKWTAIDTEAKKTAVWVFTNAVGAKGKVYANTPAGFKEICARSISGYNAPVTFTQDVALKEGEIVNFEVGNGGDGYFDDAVKPEITVSATLVGEWVFNSGTGLNDRKRHWGSFTLQGGAKLVADGLELTKGAWARATTNRGGTKFAERTLVAWVKLKNNPDVRPAGAAMSVYSVKNAQFDGIVLGERANMTWMAGSEGFRRTNDPVSATAVEKSFDTVVKVAISYADAGGGKTLVTMIRNGERIHQYTTGVLPVWTADSADVLFGARHLNGTAPVGYINGTIVAAQLYNVALSEEALLGLSLPG